VIRVTLLCDSPFRRVAQVRARSLGANLGFLRGDMQQLIKAASSINTPHSGRHHLQQMAVGIAKVERLAAILPCLP
jgi:hypothetical protein